MPQNKVLTKLNGPWVSMFAIVLVVGVIWAAKAVLLPLALAIILAFVLTPFVRSFDRMHVPRGASVALTMLIALSFVGGVSYVIFDQFAQLSTEAVKYTSSMRNKVAQLQLGNGAVLRQLTRTVDKVTEQLDENAVDLRRAQPVRVVPPRLTAYERLQASAGAVFEPLASMIIVIVLVAFMLGQREDLRDRFIRLIGRDHVTLTTRLMDDAAQRVSRFLVAQVLINIVFGALVAGGLYWIGVPYAALWGGLTAFLRFVPYVGTALSALVPAILAFATFPGWLQTLQTLALFLVLDGITAYFVEPLVFGRRTGVSSFALLVSALFWIWVWGPVGLLLATPLTVCIAVLGRHVPSLRFLAVIFADEPALRPQVRFYQRLLARDEDEAHALAERQLAELGPIGVMDQVLLPALAMAVELRDQNEISQEDADFIAEATAEIVQQLPRSPATPERRDGRVVGIAARTSNDQLALEMLCSAFDGLSADLEVIPADAVAQHAIAQTIAKRPSLVCIVSVSPTRGSEVRTFCRQLRAELQDTRILVLRPNVAGGDIARSSARMKDAGADCVVTTIREALEGIEMLLPQVRGGAGAMQSARARLAVASER